MTAEAVEEEETEPARCVHCNALAETGVLGKRCARNLRRQLREIADLYEVLDTRPTTTNNPYSPAKRHQVSGSPALIRLDVLTMQDPRTRTSAKDHEPEDDNDPASDTPTMFQAWANTLAKVLNLRSDGKPWQAPTLPAAVDLLTGEWFGNLCYQPWTADLFVDVEDQHQLLRRLVGIRSARCLGTCTCGRRIYEPQLKPGAEPEPMPDDGTIIECRCGHRLNALAIIRLRAAQRVQETG